MLFAWLTGCVDPARHQADLPAVMTSAEWRDYFAAHVDNIPWDQEPHITPAELAAVGTSLSAWQLGESSEGAHLRAAARNHADRTGDPPFAEAMALFIAEEQRHGRTLGRYLDLVGVPRLASNWGDTCFRWLRHGLPDLETWTTPVLMAEVHALVYYNAIRQATGCPLLRAICAQLLRDEVPHIRFQCERLAILHRYRPIWLRAVTMLLHRVLFVGVTLAIWAGHRRALRAGGYHFGRFWRTAWTKMRHAWKMADPEGYRW